MSNTFLDLADKGRWGALEAEASDILNSGSADKTRLRRLCNLLFAELGDNIVLGSFVRIKSGIRTTTKQYPETTKLLTHFLSQEFPGDCFVTIDVAKDNDAEPHKDSQNSPFPSLLCNISEGSPGGTWIEHPEGEVPRMCPDGKIRRGHIVRGSRYRLSANRLWHAAAPDGPGRVMLIGWVPSGWQHLSREDVHQLLLLGFQMPTLSLEQTCALSLWRGKGLVQTRLEQYSAAAVKSHPTWRPGQLRALPRSLHVCLSSDEEAEQSGVSVIIDLDSE